MAKRSPTKKPRLKGWDFYGHLHINPAAETDWLNNPVAIGAAIVYPYSVCGDEKKFCCEGYKGWVCTRPYGHPGPHVAVGNGEPAYGMWGRFTAREWKVILAGIRLGVAVDV